MSAAAVANFVELQIDPLNSPFLVCFLGSVFGLPSVVGSLPSFPTLGSLFLVWSGSAEFPKF